MGTGGGQIVLDEWLGAAVEIAACEEVLAASPESCNGTSEPPGDAPPRPEAALPPFEIFPLDPVPGPPEEPEETGPVENREPDKDVVGTLSGSELVPVLPVWPLAV